MRPWRYRDASYEDVPKNIQKGFERIVETRKGMYIHGGVGTGKTHIAYALADNALQKTNIGSRFYNTTELLKEIRLDFDRPYSEKRHVDEILMEYRGILFLDDIGSEKISDWVAETFYLIINHHYNEGIPIIFTSNLTVAELSERVGERIASRIVEMCDIYELTGADRRLK